MEAGPVRNTSPGTATAVAMTKPIAPPRPPNAWILYRSDKLKELPPVPAGERRAQSDVSRLISSMWKQETDATRQFYERLADEKKQEHSAKYPGYRFQPMKKEEKAAIREQKKVEKEVVRKARQRGRQPQQPPYPELPQQQLQVFAPMPFLQAIPYAPLLQLPSPPRPSSPPPSSLYPPRRPGTVYYPMELYGSAGPSPPVSLACTPVLQACTELPPEEEPEELQLSESCPPTPPPPVPPVPPPLPVDPEPAAASSVTRPPAVSTVNPYLALLGPIAAQYPNIQAAQPSPMPTYANPTLPAAMPNIMPSNAHASLLQLLSQHQYPTAPDLTYAQPPDSQEQTQATTVQDVLAQNTGSAASDVPAVPAQNAAYGNDSTPDVFDYENLQFPTFENQQLSFNVGADFFQSLSNNQEGGSSGSDALEAIRLGNDLFQLPHFDASLLDLPPQGDLSVDLGQFGEEFDFSSFIDTGMLDRGSAPVTNDSFDQAQQVNESVELEPLPQHIFDLIQASLESSVDHSPLTASFSSMPPTPVVGPGALSIDLSNTDPSQRSHAHYAPPSGAPQYATRRVAGSWKPPPFLEHEDYNQPIPSPIGVSQ